MTIRVRRRAQPSPDALLGEAPPRLSRAEVAALFGAAARDLEEIGHFAAAYGLTVTGTEPASRSIRLHGTAAQYQQAFGVELQGIERDGVAVRLHQGGIALPPELAPIVEAVLGLDDRRIAIGRIWHRRAVWPAPPALSPAAVAAAYRLPPAFDGGGRRVGIIAFSEAPEMDLRSFRQLLHRSSTVAEGAPTPKIRILPAPDAQEEGPIRRLATREDRDALDAMLQVIAGLAPGAEILVQLARPTERGCVDALADAVHRPDPPLDVLCIGWGAPEAEWSGQAAQAMEGLLLDAALLGITVCVASGDAGAALPASDDAETTAGVDLPASIPYALACGGTAPGLLPGREVVWNDMAAAGCGARAGGASGGGISEVFGVPPWQSGFGLPRSVRTARHGRGVPDVAAFAAPMPGVFCLIDGVPHGCGGTAVAAAIWAALMARLAQAVGAGLGPIALRLGEPGMRRWLNDVVAGSNDPTGEVGGYLAGPGWDACTGLGSPDGLGMLDELLQAADPGPGPRLGGEDLPLDWTPWPGLAHDIGVGPGGNLWALGPSPRPGAWPLYLLGAFGWGPHPFGRGLGSGFAVAPDGAPWLHEAEGAIWRWNASMMRWDPVPGEAMSLAFAGDGAAWIVTPAPPGEDGAVLRWSGIATGFAPVGGLRARRLRSSFRDAPLAITALGDALRRRDDGQEWSRVARGVDDIAEDRMTGTLWAISRQSKRIWRLDPTRAAWQRVGNSVAARVLPLPHLGLFTLGPDGRIWLGHTPPPRNPGPVS